MQPGARRSDATRAAILDAARDRVAADGLKLPPTVAMSRGAVIAWLAPTVQRYLTARDPAAAP